MERCSTQHGPCLDEELAEASDGLVHGTSPSAVGRAVDQEPVIAGTLVTGFQLATFPLRLTIAAVREVHRLVRRIARGS